MLKTDDREIVRVDASCRHRRCPLNECLAYTKEALEITPVDEERAKQLIAEGWRSTSRKSRSIARWRVKPPTVDEIFGPELLATFHGQRMAEVLRNHEKWHSGVSSPAHDMHIEHETLSPSLFRAFKQAGGDCGR